MQVLKRTSGYTQDPTRYLNLERFSVSCSDFVLIEAGFEKANLWDHYGYRGEDLKKLLKRKIVRLEFEEPNKFFIGDNPAEYEKYFYKVFSLCPYTCDWINSQNANKTRVPIFFPFNEEYIPKESDKIFDIIYSGHIVSKTLLSELFEISKFNYRFVSNSKHPLVTNTSASYEEKMKLVSQTKITLVHNILYPKIYHILNVWRVKNYKSNGAFALIPKWYNFWKIITDKNIVVPQLKSRVFEAAFGRSLILCKKDHFNVIERYFEPEREFVYYEEGRLGEKIKEILLDFGKYEKVIDNAYKKAVENYTVEKFVDKYLKDLV
jgi:hypothetical protein